MAVLFMITLSHLTFSYPGSPPVLRDISLHIEAGSHVAVMGTNGSGKSTLALLLKGLHLPGSGAMTVDGFDPSRDERSRFEVMRRVGLVFQNPDNAIVATTVERELAFGLENLGVPEREMRERVDEALVLFDLERNRHADPGRLSGGERQRLALAGVMIMRPAHLVLDEPTSLLDPAGGERILTLIREAAGRGTTIVHITQFAAEALTSDRLVVLGEGGVLRDGAPREVLRETAALGIESLTDVETLFLPGDRFPEGAAPVEPSAPAPVSLTGVSFTYDRGTPFARQALEGVTLPLPKGTATVLLGPAGSGKSTLLEIAAGITPPTAGKVALTGNPLRAMAFQFPEDEIFGETVEEYVSFGPHNVGFSEEEVRRAVDESLSTVGLAPDRYRTRDPLTLSGGEKRRAALAGVLAMRPEVLVLDEPTAGLDRSGVERITGFLREYGEKGGTLLFSTHDFRVARHLARFALVLDRGRAETYGELAEVFAVSPWLRLLRERMEARLGT
jgi:energy-coupling factor transport system ATP-binding protein